MKMFDFIYKGISDNKSFKKILSIVGVIITLFAIPVTVYLTQTTEEVNSGAQVVTGYPSGSILLSNWLK